jgi:predicted RNase H-like nuclease (RuvC/YqgF family)
MTKTFLGLALASELAKVEKDGEYHRGLVLKLEEAAKDDNETIERFQQLHNGLTRQVAELTAKNESLKARSKRLQNLDNSIRGVQQKTSQSTWQATSGNHQSP